MSERARLRPRPRHARADGTADEALSRQRGARAPGPVKLSRLRRAIPIDRDLGAWKT